MAHVRKKKIKGKKSFLRRITESIPAIAKTWFQAELYPLTGWLILHPYSGTYLKQSIFLIEWSQSHWISKLIGFIFFSFFVEVIVENCLKYIHTNLPLAQMFSIFLVSILITIYCSNQSRPIYMNKIYQHV